MMDETNSILWSIKKLLGIEPEIENFDADIIMNINSAIYKLRQLGIGPRDGYYITNEKQTYDDYLIDSKKYQSVKMYIFFTVKLAFDPPSNSFTIESIRQQLAELETRFIYQESEVT